MSKVLVLICGDRPDAPLAWRLVDRPGSIITAGTGRLDAPDALDGGGGQAVADTGESLGAMAGEDAILVLPGFLVSAIEANLPARSERQALAAAPFAVEDELASEPDTLHFALVPGRRAGGDGQRTVLAIDRALLSDWVAAVAAAGLRLRAALPDFLCLPHDPERVVALGTDDGLVLRHGDWGTAIESDIAGAVVPTMIESRAGEDAARLLAGPDHGVGGFEGPEPGAADPLDVLTGGAVQAGPGLLQGAFAVRERGHRAGDVLAMLRWPAALAAVATLAFSAVSLVQGMMLDAKAEAVRAESRALFLSAFPGTERVVNLRAQLRRVSQEQQGQRPDFLVLSGYVAAGVDAVDEVSIESLRFDTEAGEISASILFDSYDALASFRAAVEAAGGRVVEGGSRQLGDRRSGDVKVMLP